MKINLLNPLKYLGLCVALSFSNHLHAQDSTEVSSNAMGQAAVYFTPSGIIQFGPLFGAQVGITKDFVLDAHFRLPQLGMKTWEDARDQIYPKSMQGITLGAGGLYFFGKGLSRAYVGAGFEFQIVTYRHGTTPPADAPAPNPYYIMRKNYFIVTTNTGYRFRFDSGFFINSGVFLGAYYMEWAKTRGYREKGYETKPVFMVELAVGFEIK